MTKQRELILNIIRTSEKHLTADEIYQEARKQLPAIALATIYNNLNYLCEHGIITKIAFLGQTDRYDKMYVRHDHMICDRCGQISDLHLNGVQKILEEETGEPIGSYDLTVHHLCPACREKTAI